MVNFGRKLGINIFALMKKSEIETGVLARELKYTYKDMCRILEGKIILPPSEIEKFAVFSG